jgi:hypothetical protein
MVAKSLKNLDQIRQGITLPAMKIFRILPCKAKWLALKLHAIQ